MPTIVPTDASFPFRWPDDGAADLTWIKRTEDPRPLPPFEQDVALRRRQSAAEAAGVKGADTSERALTLNGHLYTAAIPSPFTAKDLHARKMAFERAAVALNDCGHTYYEKVVFPEVDEVNARLQGVDVQEVSAEALADHFEETLDWYERQSTLHRLRVADDPSVRFSQLYARLTGDSRLDGPVELFAGQEGVLDDAIDLVLELARIAHQHAPLLTLLRSRPPHEALAALSSTEGGQTFNAAFGRLIERQGLRCGDNPGDEWEPVGPSWLEEPSLAMAVVQRYLRHGAGHLPAEKKRAADSLREQRVRQAREGIADDQTRGEFDFLLEGARRSLQHYEDHSYKIDSGAAALLRRARVAAGARLAAAGVLEHADDVTWLHADEIATALRGLGGEPGTHWRTLVEAHQREHAWQSLLAAPSHLGAPAKAPPKPAKVKLAPAAKTAPPAEALVCGAGQPGAETLVTGTVRLMLRRNTEVPEFNPGDVLVAKDVSPIWAPLLPLAGALVLESSALLAHGAMACRRLGVPLVYQAKDATKRLRDGDVVMVDAANGWVLPLPQGMEKLK